MQSANAELATALTPRMTEFIPYAPHPKQQAFLLLPHREAMFGGSAGGGKSDSLLMAALQYVDIPRYSAIVFRRTFTELDLPGALMDRAKSWLVGTGATWKDSSHTWTFPSGATLAFGYLERDRDVDRYYSAEFQFIGFDELTQFTEKQYRTLFSRLRRPKKGPLSQVPLRMRSASNPGGTGHEWVKRWFVDNTKTKDRIFLPARLYDNPSLDQEAYIASLNNLDQITRKQLLDGDWTAQQAGDMFNRNDFPIVDHAPKNTVWARRWDMASSKPRAGRDPDWTAGALVGLSDGVWYIADMKRLQGAPSQTEGMITEVAKTDPRGTRIRMEQEPGSSGVTVIDYFARKVLVGYDFEGKRSTGNKVLRAQAVASAVGRQNVKLIRGMWISDFLDEFEAFPHGSHDDQVDAVSGAFEDLKHAGPLKGMFRG